MPVAKVRFLAMNESETLNSPITEDEVSKSVKRLKNGKACEED